MFPVIKPLLKQPDLHFRPTSRLRSVLVSAKINVINLVFGLGAAFTRLSLTWCLKLLFLQATLILYGLTDHTVVDS
jgi:hypothetical protein